MSEATAITNTPSIAAVPPAPPEAHQRADREAAIRNLKKLPSTCYVFIPSRPVGERIGIIRAGEMGYYSTGHDAPVFSVAAARVLVDRLNVRIGVTDAQQLAMVAGSLYGFHVPAADPEHPTNTGALRAVDPSMMR